MSDIRNHGPYIGEDDFEKELKDTVRPYIYRYMTEGYMDTYDNKKLHYLFFIAPEEKASVNLIHGKGEYFEKYEETTYYLLRGGYSVFFLEQRGFGKSEKLLEDSEKVHVDSFDDYIRDQWDFFWNIVNKETRSDIRFMMGHSMGGLIAGRFAEVHPQAYRAAALASPMFEMKYKIPRLMVRILLTINKKRHRESEYALGQHGYKGSCTFEESHDRSRARFNAYSGYRENNEYCRSAGVTNGWLIEAQKMEKASMDDAESASIPILLMQAGCDKLVKSNKQLMFAGYSKDTLIVQFPRSGHEIYAADDEERALFYDWILSFFDESYEEIKR
ncbi:MAG: alpha/beta hydrolase [Lachnospiraceae bacterium]|jgi:lysophospholipase|nr:alpha/beta hydrolase [Lachnospiraceae bacterium]